MPNTTNQATRKKQNPKPNNKKGLRLQAFLYKNHIINRNYPNILIAILITAAKLRFTAARSAFNNDNNFPFFAFINSFLNKPIAE